VKAGDELVARIGMGVAGEEDELRGRLQPTEDSVDLGEIARVQGAGNAGTGIGVGDELVALAAREKGGKGGHGRSRAEGGAGAKGPNSPAVTP
jgi:hypothetical protein